MLGRNVRQVCAEGTAWRTYCTPSALNTASTGSAKKPVWNLANNSPGMVGMSLTLAIGNRIRLAPASKATGEVAHERSFQVDFRLHTSRRFSARSWARAVRPGSVSVIRCRYFSSPN